MSKRNFFARIFTSRNKDARLTQVNPI